MSIARLTAIIEAVTGVVSTPAQVLRIGNRIYVLTETPDPGATNNEKAVACVHYLRAAMRGMNRAGEEALQKALAIEAIQAAADAAVGDL